MIQVSYSIGHEDISNGWIVSPNSAGGVSVRMSLKNLSEKTIKYYSLFFIPYNAVGDAVSCSIRHESERGVRGTGPIAQNQTVYNQIFENAWYDFSIKSARLSKAYIEYMDGTTETIQGYQIQSLPAAQGGGCYVATAVYGSYDCPQVWTLRRYRDNKLGKTWYGRTFIRTYYAISPTLVKWFGNTNWFKKMWRGKLDRMVAKLRKEGFESTPYDDIIWR